MRGEHLYGIFRGSTLMSLSETPLLRCRKCQHAYREHEDDDGLGTGLCGDCFEASVEDYEERKRERIARENEY